MKANQVQTISFIRTKGGHTAAIINNHFTVVKNTKKEPVFTVYKNIAKGIGIESTPEMIEEFTKAFTMTQEEKTRAIEEQKRKEEEDEKKRISALYEMVTGLTPQDFAEKFNLDITETARHWSDLHEGKSSFSIIISNAKEYELTQIAESVNNWGGEWGELEKREGAHHSTFSQCYDLNDWHEMLSNHFAEKFFFKSRETEEEAYIEMIKDSDSMDEISDLVDEFNNIEEGYYSTGGNLVFSGDDFSDTFSYNYDVYRYKFGYKLPSKNIFYGNEKN